ncbi:hypothetical protein C6571_19325 (plasmid) [Simplicispira suum]|uniref:Uncharacterized protein n=1 Tax=Simplicispira suum TaxID=2109915 RepID=A0A2S0N601_9BURK|nr:hypothetical protein C6571_19325 [Simplicispira suum]
MTIQLAIGQAPSQRRKIWINNKNAGISFNRQIVRVPVDFLLIQEIQEPSYRLRKHLHLLHIHNSFRCDLVLTNELRFQFLATLGA